MLLKFIKSFPPYYLLHHVRNFIPVLLVLAAGICSVAHYGYQYYLQQEQIQTEVISLTQRIDEYLNGLVTLSFSEMAQLLPTLQQANNDTGRIHAALVKKVDVANGVLRFGWADNNNLLRVGAAKGIYANPPSLASRAYISHARQAPGEFFAGPLLQHIVTGRPVIILYTGVVKEGKGYIGTLIATLDVANIIEHLNGMARNVPADMMVTAPHGEDVVVIGDRQPASGAGMPDGSRFHVWGRVKPHYLHDLAKRYIVQWTAFNAIAALLILLGYRFIQQRWVQPERKAIAILDKAAVEIHPAAGYPEAHTLPARIEALYTQLEKYVENQKQIDAWQQQVQHMKRHFLQAQKEHAVWLNSTSQEMEHIFNAISGYAQALEEQALQRRIDPSGVYDFDDVTEAGENMKFIANGFYLVSLYKMEQQPVHLQRVDLVSMISKVVHMLAPSIERRNIELFISPPLKHVWVHCDEDMFRHVLWGILYLAVKYADNEATLQLILLPSHTPQLQVKVSRANREMVLQQERDLRPFVFPDANELRVRLLTALKQHVNVIVSRFFMQAMEGSIDVYTSGTLGYGMHIILPEMADTLGPIEGRQEQVV